MSCQPGVKEPVSEDAEPVAQDDALSTALRKPRKDEDGIRLLCCPAASRAASQPGRLAATDPAEIQQQLQSPQNSQRLCDPIHPLNSYDYNVIYSNYR